MAVRPILFMCTNVLLAVEVLGPREAHLSRPLDSICYQATHNSCAGIACAVCQPCRGERRSLTCPVFRLA